jgi:hypothetical protein
MVGMGRTRNPTDAELRERFEEFLELALTHGEGGVKSCTGISRAVFEAIDAVADEYPNASKQTVQAAREAFAFMMEPIE